MLKRKWIAVIVVVVVVAGVTSAFYIPRLLRKPLPSVIANNAVLNETVSGQFWNYTGGPTPGRLYAVFQYNETSAFTYHSITSNLTLRTDFSTYGFGPNGTYVQAWAYLQVFGNISADLHPSGGQIETSVSEDYASSSAFVFGNYIVFSKNISAGAGGWQGKYYNFAYNDFKLVNQTTPQGFNEFYLFYMTQISLPKRPISSNSTSLITFSVSLSGFANPVNATLNLNYIDES